MWLRGAEGFCLVCICAFLHADMEKDEGWNTFQHVEIPFSLPLLFVLTAGLSRGSAGIFRAFLILDHSPPVCSHLPFRLC